MRSRTPRFLAAAMATLLVAVACGDDDDDTAVINSGPGGEETSEPTTGQEESATTETEASDEDPGALLLVMDASGSMNNEHDDGGTLLDEAKQALVDVVNELPDDQHVGLRVYGHRYPNTDRENGCSDSELIHPVDPLDRDALTSTIEGYDAQGFTPIGLSLRESADDLPAEGPRTMILVSDGEETCDTDPCAAAEQIGEEGIELTIHTVGFALDTAAPDEADQARDELNCIAEAGGGTFVDASDATELTEAIETAAREDRTFTGEGSELPGAPIPRDANTGGLDTSHVDTVLASEVNYYRFEVTPGTEVRGELIVPPTPDTGCDTGLTAGVDLTDEAGDAITDDVGESFGASESRDTRRDTIVVHTDTVEVDDDVWLEVSTECKGKPDDELPPIELQLTTVD